MNDFTKYLTKTCLNCSGQHFFIKFFPTCAFVCKISSKLSGCFWAALSVNWLINSTDKIMASNVYIPSSSHHYCHQILNYDFVPWQHCPVEHPHILRVPYFTVYHRPGHLCLLLGARMRSVEEWGDPQPQSAPAAVRCGSPQRAARAAGIIRSRPH